MKTTKRRRKLKPKDIVRKLLDRIPDDASLEDIQYHIYICRKIERGFEDIKAGRVYSQEETEQWMAQWLEE